MGTLGSAKTTSEADGEKMKRRKEIIMKNLSNNRYIERVQTKAIEYAKEQIKNHFGKEFHFYGNHQEVLDVVTNKFIAKYDKKFKSHSQKKIGNTREISDIWFITKLDEATYMYVASGINIGNIEKRFLLNSSNNSTDISIYIFGRKYYKYAIELEKLTQKLYNSNELGLFTIDFAKGYGNSEDKSESLDVMYSSLAPRSLDTLFFSDNEKERIIEHMDRFQDNKEFYASRQLLYKTGILLYGQPGTGKSSLVKALANTYGRSIANINTSNLDRIDLNKLTKSIDVDEQREFIVLLEDIDTLFLNRENGESDKDDQAIINKLLQFLDSNTSPSNVIFIATTNHIERLDEALLREGRFDLKVECNPLTMQTAIEFGKTFGLSEKDMREICDEIVRDKHITEPNPRFNQSTLQTRILARLTHKSTDRIVEIYGEMQE